MHAQSFVRCDLKPSPFAIHKQLQRQRRHMFLYLLHSLARVLFQQNFCEKSLSIWVLSCMRTRVFPLESINSMLVRWWWNARLCKRYGRTNVLWWNVYQNCFFSVFSFVKLCIRFKTNTQHTSHKRGKVKRLWIMKYFVCVHLFQQK